jgi:hypothetical protein
MARGVFDINWSCQEFATATGVRDVRAELQIVLPKGADRRKRIVL